jgi:hypothetical protein
VKKNPTTPAAIVKRLRKLAKEMLDLGVDMDYYGGITEIGKKGREMVGAAKIAESWIKGIEAQEANQ